MLHSRITGGYSFYKATYLNDYLASVINVSTGQLPVTTDLGRLIFAQLKYFPSESGTAGDDLLFFNMTAGQVIRMTAGQVIRTDARYDGARYTYWWAYTKNTPYAWDWPVPRRDKWAILRCKSAAKLIRRCRPLTSTASSRVPGRARVV